MRSGESSPMDSIPSPFKATVSKALPTLLPSRPLFPGAQQVDRISSVVLPELKCPDASDGRSAVVTLVQGFTAVEECELSAINLHGHTVVVDLIP